MKNKISVISHIVLCGVVLAAGLCGRMAFATPYASGITNDGAGNISFYLNESGGSVVVTYEDGTTNATFDGVSSTATNLPSGLYSFSLGAHTSYAIAVTKYGNGVPTLMPNVVQFTTNSTTPNPYNDVTNLFVKGNMRGIAVNKNPQSPYFGRIYLSCGSATPFYDFNPDGTLLVNGTTAGISGLASTTYSPNKISIAPNDDVVAADWSSANAGVWLVSPDLSTNQLLLGPAGDANGVAYGSHGGVEGPAILLGDLNSGATLLTVDGDLDSSAPNSMMIYSNLTYSALPWQSAPTLVGPEVGINYPTPPSGSILLYPSLSVGPNGYVYSGEYRSGPSSSNPAGVQVYDANYNQLWTSSYHNGSAYHDYFYTAATGGSANLPSDSAVSPDGQYIVALGIDNHFTLCHLTNGIPDISTISTVVPSSFVGNGRAICWDAADNIYFVSSGTACLQAWTLNKSTTAVTTGNASGSTSFSMETLNTTVNVYATNNPVISQANSYGNPTSGDFTIVRSGSDLSAPLTVSFTYGGTATNGTYTASVSGSVTFTANQTTTNITIAPVTDGVPRFTTVVTLTVTPSPNYLIGSGSASISILNTAEDKLVAAIAATSMYNAYSNDYVSLTLTRLGDSNAPAYTVDSYSFAGTAVEGTDYTAPTPVMFNPGDLTKTVYIYPLRDGQPVTHSITNPYVGNKTIVLTLNGSGSYTTATNTQTFTIVDSALPPETVLYADPLTDPSDAANWSITAACDQMGNTVFDTEVEFGFDLTTADYYPIPFPPNGSQYALKMTVNKDGGPGANLGGPATAINAYMTNQAFSGNYAVRFNMCVIQGYCDADSSMQVGGYNPEEGAIFGINHNGMETNLFFPDISAINSQQTEWASDGVWYWISDSGGRYDNSITPYEAFTGNGSVTTNTGWAPIGTGATSTFAQQFKSSVFSCYASANVPPYNSGWTEGGPGLPVNGSANVPDVGFSPDYNWADVEIKQYNGVVTLSINKTPIFVYTNQVGTVASGYTNTYAYTSGFPMLGYEDPYDGGEDYDTAVYYSNFRVVSIGGPVIGNLSVAGGTLTMNFRVTDDGTSFALQGASSVQGPYTNVADATITSLGGGEYQVTVPVSSSVPAQFYRILQQ